ncbi:MAG TPA: ABC transporter substrate-binding protein, partial [Chloroflexota bacterium]|nr:ABC transporter substrate-binding protein [Chloroflexota bacterium]
APVAAAATAPKPAAATQPTAAARPTPAPPSSGAAPNQLPRSQTLIFSESDAVNQFADVQIMNPHMPGIARSGWHFAFEPLFLYNPYYSDQVCGPPGVTCKNGEIPWQAESYAYNPDYTGLSIKLRSGVTWSDGQPFTASDVAFTVNMLKDNAPKLTWSVDMHQWVKEAVAVDPLTVNITLTGPNPRFMFNYFMFHEDLGVVILPEHIFKGQDPTTFTNFDMSKGWPVVTGPWKLTLSASEQKFWDRRDDWWGAKTGFHNLPAMRRIIDLPNLDDAKRIELLASNQVDGTHDLQPANALAALARNDKLIMWTKESPYGCLDWWPTSMFFNDSKPPFNDPDIRWAINHALDRDQIVQLGYHGAGTKSILPFPAFLPMKPSFDAVSDILQKYPIDAFDLNKSAQIMQSKGYAKDQGGFWAKDGKRFSLEIQLSPSFFLDITPVIVAQLRKAGFDASFKSPSNFGTVEATGAFDAVIDGIGASVNDPYYTLSFFQSRYSAPTGQPATHPYRWKNDQYDKIVDEMGNTSPSDPKLMNLYHQAMEIWIPNLPGIPLVQHYLYMPVNTTYWTDWPTAQNPYIIPSNWHRTSTLFINTLKPVTS